MHSFFRQPRALAKLGALALVFLLSFCLYGLYCINTVTEVKINGPQYQRIVQGKDIIADVLPPPGYLIETYLTAFELMRSGDPAEAAALRSRLAGLKEEYLARHAYWETRMPEGALGRKLVRESYLPARALLESLDSQFLPALQAGDKALAATLLEGPIRKAYDAHRKSIDEVVELAKRRNQEDEARAAVVVQSRIYGQMAVGLFLLILLVSFTVYVFLQIEAPRDGNASSEMRA